MCIPLVRCSSSSSKEEKIPLRMNVNALRSLTKEQRKEKREFVRKKRTNKKKPSGKKNKQRNSPKKSKKKARKKSQNSGFSCVLGWRFFSTLFEFYHVQVVVLVRYLAAVHKTFQNFCTWKVEKNRQPNRIRCFCFPGFFLGVVFLFVFFLHIASLCIPTSLWSALYVRR